MKYTFFYALGGLLLTLAGCSSKTTDPVQPDQGQVMFVHTDFSQPNNPFQVTVDNTAAGQYTYGQSNGNSYVVLDAGQHALKVNGIAVAGLSTITVAKNRAYTCYFYPSVVGVTAGQLAPDDLTTPPTGMARLRLINNTAGVSTDVKLARATTTGGTTTYQDVTSQVSGNSTSLFQDFTPSTTSLVLLDANNTVLAQVGTGSGSGTGVTKYETGRVYTVVASGIYGSTNADSKLKVFLFINK